jgi:hypothetical protein
MHNANSNIFGKKASSTVLTTPVNTTQHGIFDSDQLPEQ